MFGYIRPAMNDLTESEKTRYRSVYCGICRSLGTRYGALSRLSVNFDMTFLALLLSSLYEQEEKSASARCLPHPFKPHTEISGDIIDYAADMTVALTYHKCLDDWKDEKKQAQRLYAVHLKSAYEKVQAIWPDQCRSIEESLSALSVIEQNNSASADQAILFAGQLLAGLFVWKRDFWSGQLQWFGASIGRFIYLMDAAMDFEQDEKTGCYNPLIRLNIPPAQAVDMLMQPLDEASEAFEALPLVQDDHLLRNILYSGVWQCYNEKMKKQTEDKVHGQ